MSVVVFISSDLCLSNLLDDFNRLETIDIFELTSGITSREMRRERSARILSKITIKCARKSTLVLSWQRNLVNFVAIVVVVVVVISRRGNFSTLGSRIIFAETDVEIRIRAAQKRLSNKIYIFTVEILKEIFYNISVHARRKPGNIQPCSTAANPILRISFSRFSIIRAIATKDRLRSRRLRSIIPSAITRWIDDST